MTKRQVDLMFAGLAVLWVTIVLLGVYYAG